MKAHVILNNDSVEFVVVGSFKKAEKKLQRLKNADYIKRYQHLDFELYEDIMFWHISSVNAIFEDVGI